MSNRISILKPQVYQKIAAGEVIERPLSVVKELVENSIDAGADDIAIRLINGGSTRISVEDNGHGFNPADIEVAFQRHTTSKLIELDDLDQARRYLERVVNSYSESGVAILARQRLAEIS